MGARDTIKNVQSYLSWILIDDHDSPPVSIVPYIVGAKEVFIFFNYEAPFRKFSK